MTEIEHALKLATLETVWLTQLLIKSGWTFDPANPGETRLGLPPYITARRDGDSVTCYSPDDLEELLHRDLV